MNTNEHPPTESAFRPDHNPCFGSDTQIAALNVFADDGNSYLLPYAQFLSAERFSNPALEQEAGRPAGKNVDRFCRPPMCSSWAAASSAWKPSFRNMN
jgi:hypothetical protein